ncbi:hypothetical protein T492DRAFT_883794 [Pavlovales sp. CCMP2436]|nr:hypothetical protein T492DRAFT_883794 [Pavlovales sp. CCMP2436]
MTANDADALGLGRVVHRWLRALARALEQRTELQLSLSPSSEQMRVCWPQLLSCVHAFRAAFAEQSSLGVKTRAVDLLCDTVGDRLAAVPRSAAEKQEAKTLAIDLSVTCEALIRILETLSEEDYPPLTFSTDGEVIAEEVSEEAQRKPEPDRPALPVTVEELAAQRALARRQAESEAHQRFIGEQLAEQREGIQVGTGDGGRGRKLPVSPRDALAPPGAGSRGTGGGSGAGGGAEAEAPPPPPPSPPPVAKAEMELEAEAEYDEEFDELSGSEKSGPGRELASPFPPPAAAAQSGEAQSGRERDEESGSEKSGHFELSASPTAKRGSLGPEQSVWDKEEEEEEEEAGGSKDETGSEKSGHFEILASGNRFAPGAQGADPQGEPPRTPVEVAKRSPKRTASFSSSPKRTAASSSSPNPSSSSAATHEQVRRGDADADVAAKREDIRRAEERAERREAEAEREKIRQAEERAELREAEAEREDIRRAEERAEQREAEAEREEIRRAEERAERREAEALGVRRGSGGGHLPAPSLFSSHPSSHPSSPLPSLLGQQPRASAHQPADARAQTPQSSHPPLAGAPPQAATDGGPDPIVRARVAATLDSQGGLEPGPSSGRDSLVREGRESGERRVGGGQPATKSLRQPSADSGRQAAAPSLPLGRADSRSYPPVAAQSRGQSAADCQRRQSGADSQRGQSGADSQSRRGSRNRSHLLGHIEASRAAPSALAPPPAPAASAKLPAKQRLHATAPQPAAPEPTPGAEASRPAPRPAWRASSPAARPASPPPPWHAAPTMLHKAAALTIQTYARRRLVCVWFRLHKVVVRLDSTCSGRNGVPGARVRYEERRQAEPRGSGRLDGSGRLSLDSGHSSAQWQARGQAQRSGGLGSSSNLFTGRIHTLSAVLVSEEERHTDPASRRLRDSSRLSGGVRAAALLRAEKGGKGPGGYGGYSGGGYGGQPSGGYLGGGGIGGYYGGPSSGRLREQGPGKGVTQAQGARNSQMADRARARLAERSARAEREALADAEAERALAAAKARLRARPAGPAAQRPSSYLGQLSLLSAASDARAGAGEPRAQARQVGAQVALDEDALMAGLARRLQLNRGGGGGAGRTAAAVRGGVAHAPFSGRRAEPRVPPPVPRTVVGKKAQVSRAYNYVPFAKQPPPRARSPASLGAGYGAGYGQQQQPPWALGGSRSYAHSASAPRVAGYTRTPLASARMLPYSAASTLGPSRPSPWTRHTDPRAPAVRSTGARKSASMFSGQVRLPFSTRF